MKSNLSRIFIFFFCCLVFSQEKKISENFPDRQKIDSLYNESISLYDKNEYKLAITKTFDAINLAYNTKDYSKLALCYVLLGNQYSNLKDNERAKESYNKSIEYALKVKDTSVIYKAYNALGNITSDTQNKTDEGITYYKKAAALAEKLKDTSSLASCLTNIGWTYLDLNKPDKAITYLLKAQQLNDKVKSKRLDLSCDLLLLTGRYYFQKGNYDRAEYYINKSINIANKQRFFFILVDLYDIRSKIYQKRNQLEKSIEDVRLYAAYNDSVNIAMQTKELEKAKAEFSVKEYERALGEAKKEQRNSELLAQENERKLKDQKRKLLFSIMTSIFTMGLLYLYFSNRARKRKNEILEEKNRILTESKEKSDNLNALKTQFISTVSHELRTPLYGILGVTNMLSEDESIGEEQQKLINSLKQSGDFLLKHINDVLKIGEIESRDEKTVEDNNINLKKLTSYLYDNYIKEVSENNNQMHIKIERNVPINVVSDDLRLKEILGNLLHNAGKFTKNGNVWLKIKTTSPLVNNKQTLLFEVEDDGIGISEDKKEVIFDKFYQANRGQKNLDGTGLGLSVVKYLLHALDSEIKVKSEENKGSVFYFSLDVEISKTNNVDEIIEEETKFIKRHILVAEDNKISQAVTRKMILALGHDCVVCDNGLETYKAAKSEKFDLILMDLNMPVMDGIASAKYILEYNKSIPIIALTALDLNQIEDDCYSVGMLYAVNKPINKENLKKIIDKYSISTLSKTA